MPKIRPIRVLCALAVATLACLPIAAGAATLSEADRRDVARIEAYLNTFTSLKARFLQQSSAGGIAEGRLYLSRPDRVRLDYRPPAALQIYANGYWLAYVDTELEEVTHVPLSSTPAGFLVREKVSLSGDLSVVQVDRNLGAIRLHVVQTEEPEAGRVILTLDDSPLQLSHWVVIDAQGTETRVSLFDTEYNLKLDDKLFDFDSRVFERRPSE
jgi:outer membrane lipoprotein-sorting protein